MRTRKMYSNRYRNMHVVCRSLLAIGESTSSAIAKNSGLSRQSVNRIMNDCLDYGYVTFKTKEHRPNVTKKIWRLTRLWVENKHIYQNFSIKPVTPHEWKA